MKRLALFLSIMAGLSFASVVTTEVYKDSDITLKIERIQLPPKVVTVSVEKIVNVPVDRIVEVEKIVPDKNLIKENKDLKDGIEYVVRENDSMAKGYKEISKKALQIKELSDKYYNAQVNNDKLYFVVPDEQIPPTINVCANVCPERTWYDNNLLWFIVGMFAEKFIKL